MTLARIITHSDLCARELAFHLLGRGYAVEIVSPDSIPDNFADLELRVDADSGDQLVASLAAYEGQRISALELVPLVKVTKDAVPLPPGVRGDALGALGDPVVIDVASTIGDTEASVDSPSRTSSSISWLAEDALEAESFPEVCPDLLSEKAAHLTPAQEVSPSSTSDISHLDAFPANVDSPANPDLSAVSPTVRTNETLSYFARQTSSIALPFAGPAVVLPIGEQQTVDRPLPWKFIAPAALTLTAVVLLSLFLAFGVRASAKPAVSSSNPMRTPAASKASSPVSANVTRPGNPGAELHIAKRPNIASRHTADVIAPDTVTYLDERYKPPVKSKPLHAKASSVKRARGNVAVDTTTYFSSATSPRPER
jgi:hypothetical protein